MTDQATRIVPAGWYEDPASTAHVRWWNGLAWTEHTTLKPTAAPRSEPAVQEPTAYATQNYLDSFQGRTAVSTSTGSTHTAETLARIAEARELERQYGISTAEHDVIVSAAQAGAAADGTPRDAVVEETLSRRALREAEYDDADEGTATASSWFIALWPLLTLVAAIVAVYVFFYVTPEPSVAGIPLVAGLIVVPYLLGLVWALADARRLRQRGHRPAGPALALLGPLVYLVARRVRVSGSGPLVALLVLTVLVVGAPLAAYLTGAATSVTTALQIQQDVRATYVDTGRLASVSCPILVESIAAGSLYECNGTTLDGRSQRVWVSIDSADGTPSYALDVR